MLKIPSKKNISLFENEWADHNGYKYGVACNSGTNALFLAVKALGIGPGDEVIVPEFTMAATAWAVSYTGANPIFVDCKDDLTIDTDKIEITEKTKAIMPVVIYGRKYDDCRRFGLPVIEDMAEGHGIKPLGDIACYSFYANKIINTEEGGMCLTNNKDLADEMRLLANMYFDKERSYLHPKMGYNFRMTDYQAKQGLKQVRDFENIISKRRQIEAWWDKYLPEEMKMPPRDTVWMYDIDCGDKQETIKQAVPMSRYFFKPMSMQPLYNHPYAHLNAYKWSKRGLYLPLWKLTEREVIKISKTIYDTGRR
jgi:dTDP-4-amino-4,6-dideoxygalactose transaminase